MSWLEEILAGISADLRRRVWQYRDGIRGDPVSDLDWDCTLRADCVAGAAYTALSTGTKTRLFLSLLTTKNFMTSKLKEKIAEHTQDYFPTWEKPGELSLEEWIETRTARLGTRKYDWNALKFQADFDPKYRRAQCRYIGLELLGSFGYKYDSIEHFTFSTMILPAGCEGPLHVHYDAEEVFFVLAEN